MSTARDFGDGGVFGVEVEVEVEDEVEMQPLVPQLEEPSNNSSPKSTSPSSLATSGVFNRKKILDLPTVDLNTRPIRTSRVCCIIS